MTTLTDDGSSFPPIYQLEITDPVKGGPDGIDNLPHQQLANRTANLKAITDQVVAASAGFDNLSAKLASFGVLDPAEAAAHYAMSFWLTDAVGALNAQARAQIDRRSQSGQIQFQNRGIVYGCAITRSTTANRNLNLATGQIFVAGKVYTVAAGTNVASVPQNTSLTASGTAYVYLSQLISGLWDASCTAIGDSPPDGSVMIARLVIPTNNTDSNDPHIASVVIILDAKSTRVEPNFPMLLSRAPNFYQPINPLPDNAYALDFDIVSANGAPCTPDNVIVTSRASNGFGILMTSAADDIVLRWTLTAKY